MTNYPGPCSNKYIVAPGFNTIVFTFSSTGNQGAQNPMVGTETGTINTTSSFVLDTTGKAPGSFRILKDCCTGDWVMQLVATSNGNYPSTGSYVGSATIPIAGGGSCTSTCTANLTNQIYDLGLSQDGTFGYVVAFPTFNCTSTDPYNCTPTAGEDCFFPTMEGSGAKIPFASLKGTHNYSINYGPDSFLFSLYQTLSITIS